MKISHESPISMLQESRLYNDYDYALVHLFEIHPEYYEFFKESLRLGRTVYLDNSIFELGEAFDADKFAAYAKELQSIADEHKNENFYIIVPDALEDGVQTIQKWESFTSKYPRIAKTIGVVQGMNYEEFLDCFWFMKQNADMIAISFDYSWMQIDTGSAFTKEEEFALGRIQLMRDLKNGGFLDGVNVHLLGCFIPREFRAYRDIPEIISLDTSNPIVHGIQGVEYDSYGLRTKMSIKLADLIDHIPDYEDYLCIEHNIKTFRDMLK